MASPDVGCFSVNGFVKCANSAKFSISVYLGSDTRELWVLSQGTMFGFNGIQYTVGQQVLEGWIFDWTVLGCPSLSSQYCYLWQASPCCKKSSKMNQVKIVETDRQHLWRATPAPSNVWATPHRANQSVNFDKVKQRSHILYSYSLIMLEFSILVCCVTKPPARWAIEVHLDIHLVNWIEWYVTTVRREGRLRQSGERWIVWSHIQR